MESRVIMTDGPARRNVASIASVVLFAMLGAPAAGAAGQTEDFLNQISNSSLSLLIIFAAVIVFVWAIIVVRKLYATERRARDRIIELEADLNDAEAALTAEPNILMIWRGRDGAPERIVGDMRGTAKVPSEKSDLMHFELWLEAESAHALTSSIDQMREEGTPFNIGVRTLQGELLEADGRTAGGMTTLRLRPLTGERRQTMELTHDTRKLARQVERLSAILDAAPIPIWLRDGEGKLVWVNQSYLKAMDAENSASVVDSGLELFDENKVTFAPTDSNEETGRRRGQTHAVIHGSKRALEVHDVKLGEGRAGFSIDRTDLEETEKELKRHIRAHTNTLDKLTAAIAIFGPDKRLKFYNTAYSSLWNLEPEWLDTHPQDGEILDRLRSERKLPEQANFRDWKDKQLAAYTTLDTLDSWWHLPDGQSLRVVAEQHPFGGVTYLYENVTETIALRSRYNELINVQRETLDNLHEGVALFGTDGCLKLYNPSYMRFWQLDENLLKSNPHVGQIIETCQMLHNDDAMWDELKYCVTELSDSRKPLQGRISRTDGMVFEFAGVPLPDGNTLLTYVDLTDSAGIEKALRERNEALEAADRLKTDFLSNVSYELRTPLTNIIGFAEGLSIGMAGDLQPKQREYLNHIESSSADLLAIIDAILDLTTIDAGAMELNICEIDIAELMQEIAQTARQRIDQRDLTLNIELAADATTLKGDRKRIGQVLSHLLSNAIGFSSKGATVRMGARRDNGDMLLWVADTGKGIDEEFQREVFERFQSRPVAGGHRGPGLGLALVKAFVELHGGRVSLLSKIDRGTTVICRFPMQQDETAKDAPEANQQATG
jgi:signal transduction histidine kinase/PAS domain-containing protein